MKTSNHDIFLSLCKEYNLSVYTETKGWLLAYPPSKYLQPGTYILHYMINRDSLYMPTNIVRDMSSILMYSNMEFSPTLFKLLYNKFIRLEKELKEIENKQRIQSINTDFN